MKKIFLFGLSICSTVLLSGQTAVEQIKSLNTRIETLEKTFERIEILGISLSAITVLSIAGIAWVYFKEIKSKAEAEVKKALQNELPAAVNKGINNHPIGSLFAQELEARARPIAIISKTGKDQNFVEFLDKNGFSNTTSYPVNKINGIDINNYSLILFDNRSDRLMEQRTMDSVIEKFKTGCKYFHFNDSNFRFNPISEVAKEIRMAGHANSESTLPKNLASALS